MTQDELTAEINDHFGPETYPGDSALVTEGSAGEAEALRIREALRGRAWQEVPDEVLREVRTGLSLLSEAGFKYYLPAFMRYLVRDFKPMHNGIDTVLELLKLPTEVNGLAVVNMLAQFEQASKPGSADFEGLIQAQLTQANATIHRFIARASQFSPAQGRVVHHFLAYIRDQRGEKSMNNEPELAIQRYWFQFA